MRFCSMAYRASAHADSADEGTRAAAEPFRDLGLRIAHAGSLAGMPATVRDREFAALAVPGRTALERHGKSIDQIVAMLEAATG